MWSADWVQVAWKESKSVHAKEHCVLCGTPWRGLNEWTCGVVACHERFACCCRTGIVGTIGQWPSFLLHGAVTDVSPVLSCFKRIRLQATRACLKLLTVRHLRVQGGGGWRWRLVRRIRKVRHNLQILFIPEIKPSSSPTVTAADPVPTVVNNYRDPPPSLDDKNMSNTSGAGSWLSIKFKCLCNQRVSHCWIFNAWRRAGFRGKERSRRC